MLEDGFNLALWIFAATLWDSETKPTTYLKPFSAILTYFVCSRGKQYIKSM